MKSHELLKIYENLPFSTQLLNFIDTHNDFEDSLKISAYPRFRFIPIIILSYPPNIQDEVIGMFYFDTEEKIFKQDYVVNVDFAHKKFVSYSRMSKDSHETEFVKGIDTFFNKYGKWDGQKGEFYCRNNGTRPWMHHYLGIEDLPDEIQDSGKKLLSKIWKKCELL
ncbi:MAG: hypothetical protein JXD21_08685 [Candidatus Omnitrophica bacterium]|nr:hypothetical protein [Candidatus Omnitrophota bacterium]